MRVLQIARQFHPKVGGIESCVLNLSRGLKRRGHDVEVVTLGRDLLNRRRLDGPTVVDSIPIHRIPHFGPRRYPIAPSWLRFVDDFDVVHIHAIDFFVDSAAIATWMALLRKPVVLTTHGGIFHTAAWRPLKNFYWRFVLKRTITVATIVIAVSESDASLFASIVPSQKLMTIPNGIDPAFRNARAPRVRGRLVCVGRVTETKGIGRVVQLVQRLAEQGVDLELVVAGPAEGDAGAALTHQAGELGVESRVRVVGELAIDNLAELVTSAHLFVSAAPHEGFGITTVEALSAGVPVLVTRTGVHEEIVRPGVNGWFWSGQPDSDAAETLRSALLLPDARLDEMRLAARESAAPFDWNRVTEKYERIFESAYRKAVN